MAHAVLNPRGMTESQPPSRLIVALGWITAVAAVIAAALGLLALVGYLVPLPAAVLTGPWWPRIGPTTALGLVTAAASLWLQRGATVRLPVRRAAQLLAVVAGTLGLLTLAGWIFGSSVGLDRLLAHPTSLAPRAAPLTRSTPNAALVLCLLGIALFTLRDLRPSRWVVFLASTLTAAFVSLITLLGYIYGAQQLFRFPTHRVFPGMGAHTAAALALLCLGCLCARPDRGPAALLVRASRGGTIARRLALVTLALPLAIGLAAWWIATRPAYGPAVGGALGTAAALVLGTTWLFLTAAWLDRADAARAQAEAQYRELLQSAPDAIVTVDAQGRIRLVNDEFERLFGYHAREATGQPVELLVPERLRGVHVAHRAHFVASPQRRPMAQEHNLVARRKDGSEFPAEIGLSPLRTGGELLVTAVVRDVTVRRRQEAERAELLAREQAALAQAEVARARVQAILESAPLGIVSVDARGAQRLINVAAARLLCAACESPASRTRGIGGLVHPGELSCATYEAAVASALRGEAVVGVEARMQMPGGQPLVLELNAAPVRDLGGTVLGAVVTFQDVTARKDLERLREEYLSLISHDLRAPLSSITLQAGTLGRVLGRAGMGEQVHRVEAILRGSQRMNRMIQDLLDTAGLESGRLELTLAPLDLGAFVTNTIEQALSPDERARVQVELPPSPVYISADRDRFDRVLLNLVSNALKYSPADRPVHVRVRRADDAARLEVIDRGTGITPEDQAHLFEKYFRARGTRTPGVGLGLYSTRLLVEAHGGQVAAASTWGQGSTFVVTLPLTPPTLTLVPPPAEVRNNKVPPRTAS